MVKGQKPNLPITIRDHKRRPAPRSGRFTQRFAAQLHPVSYYLKLVTDRCRSQGKDTGAVTHVAKHNPIAASTLARHWKKWRNQIRDQGFTKELVVEIDKERRGGHNKAMKPDEELLLDTQLSSLNHDGHIDFTNRIIKIMAQRIVNERSREVRSLGRPFRASNWWVTNYKKRYLMVSGVRPPKNRHGTPDPAEVATYIDNCQRWVKRSGTDYFFNIDESKWKLVNPQRIVVQRRWEHPVIAAPAKISKGFTCIFGGNASGDKLRPSIIIKGEDDDVMAPFIAKYGNTIGIYRTQKGWSNSDIICAIIRADIIPRLAGRKRSDRATLVLDKYGGHNTADVQRICDDNHIKLIMVPTSATPICQPMDISAIGATKQRARTIYTEWQMDHINGTIEMDDAVQMMISSWNTINISAITKGFKSSMGYTVWPSTVATGPSAIGLSVLIDVASSESKLPIDTSSDGKQPALSRTTVRSIRIKRTRQEPEPRGSAIYDFPGMAGDAVIDPALVVFRSSKRVKK